MIGKIRKIVHDQRDGEAGLFEHGFHPFCVCDNFMVSDLFFSLNQNIFMYMHVLKKEGDDSPAYTSILHVKVPLLSFSTVCPITFKAGSALVAMNPSVYIVPRQMATPVEYP
jgi:hypothetical protein